MPLPRLLHWYELPRDDARHQADLAPMCAAGVRMLVESQLSLDARFLADINGWDETGIPPIGRVWSSCRLEFDVACVPGVKRHAGERTRLAIAPRMNGAGRLAFNVGYVPETWDVEE